MTLKGHTGLVKGLTWDPVGKYIASQADDHSLKVWRTMDWQMETNITKPFSEVRLQTSSCSPEMLVWDCIYFFVLFIFFFFKLFTCLYSLFFSFSLALIQCGGTTHVLRLSWSPDGQYLVSAHAMNNSGPTAQIIERDGWKTNMDFVGHRKAVTVVVSVVSDL